MVQTCRVAPIGEWVEEDGNQGPVMHGVYIQIYPHVSLLNWTRFEHALKPSSVLFGAAQYFRLSSFSMELTLESILIQNLRYDA